MSRALTSIMQLDLSYNEKAKAKFHKEGKRVLKQVVKAMGLETGTYSVRSNMGGIAVSGEITLHTEKVYVQLSQSCMGKGNEILLRKCNGMKDYSGGQNNFAPVEALENLDDFAKQLFNLAQRPG